MAFKTQDIKALITNHITDLVIKDNWTPITRKNELVDMVYNRYYKNDISINISCSSTTNTLYIYRNEDFKIKFIDTPNIETINDLETFLREIDKDINSLLTKANQ